MATSIATLSMPIGCIMGLVIGPFFIPETDKLQPELGRQHVEHYCLVSAFIVSFLSGWLLIFFKEKPRFFPSMSSMLVSHKEGEFDLKKELVLLCKNKSYVSMVISFCMMYGVYTSLGAIINNLVDPFGYTPVDSSIFGATLIFFGLVGSAIASYYLDKTHKYLLILRISVFGSLISSIGMMFTLPTESTLMMTVNIAVLGLFLIPIIPIGYSFSIELTHPVSEAMSNGVMVFFSQIVGTVITIIATPISGYHPERQYCTILFIFMVGISCVASLFIKEDLRRLNASKNMSSMISNKNSNMQSLAHPNSSSKRQQLLWMHDNFYLETKSTSD